MKNKYILLLIFLFFNSILKAQNPIITVKSIDAPCLGKGKVIVNLSKVTGDLAVTLIPISGSSIPKFKNSLNDESAQFIFNDLPHTKYNIVVELNNIVISSNLTAEISVSANELDIQPFLSDHCGGAQVSIDVLSGEAIEYIFILKHNGKILKDWSNKRTFVVPYSYFTEATPSSEKNIIVKARDICGNTDSKEIFLRDFVKKFTSNTVKHQFKFNSCTSVEARFKFKNSMKHSNYSISNFRYPLTFQYKVTFTDPSSTVQNYITTIDSPSEISDVFNINLPSSVPFYGKIFTGELTIIDNCKKKYPKAKFELIRNKPEISNQSRYCFEYIHYKIDYPVLGSKISLVNGPNDSVTGKQIVLSDYFDTSTNFILIKQNQVNFYNRTTSLSIGKNKQLPLGDFIFQETFCGQTKSSKFSLNIPVSNKYFYVDIVPGCIKGTSDISLKLEGQKYSKIEMDKIEEIYVSSAPSDFIAIHGKNFPVPLNAFGTYTGGLQSNNIYAVLENVPVGEYVVTAKIKSVCENKIIEVITPIIIDDYNTMKEEFEVNVNQFCGSFRLVAEDKLVSSEKIIFFSGIAFHSTIFLQRYNPTTKLWGSLDGSLANSDDVYQKDPIWIYGKKLWVRESHEWGSDGANFLDISLDETIPSTALNGSKDGKYRLIHVYTNFEAGYKYDYNSSPSFRACLQVLKEFEVNLTKVELKSYDIFRCENDVTVNIKTSGDTPSNPFKYQVTEKNGENVSMSNPKTLKSTLKLSGDTQYKIEVSGSCDSQIININTSNVEFPKIEPFKICSGENASLKVSGSTGFDVEWLVSDDGVNYAATNITGKYFNFTPFIPSIHNKFYKVIVRNKGRNICSSKGLVFDLKSIGDQLDLGEGSTKSYTEKEAKEIGVVSLSDFLKNDETQNSGIWTAVDSSIKIINGTVDLSSFNQDTSYKFKYFAENICQDNKEVFVIISIVGSHKLIVPNVITPFQNNNKFLRIRSDGFDAIQIEICNRWGNTVYMSDNYKNDWAGKSSVNGTRAVVGNGYLPTGTYFYKLKTKITSSGEEVFQKGWIYITTD